MERALLLSEQRRNPAPKRAHADHENVVLTGSITSRQRDRETREVKCVIQGVTLDGGAAETIVKVGHGGKLVFITVYAL